MSMSKMDYNTFKKIMRGKPPRIYRWDYRIFNIKGEYSIREVYYGEDGRTGWTDPIELTGDSLEDLKQYYEEMKEAFDHPIIDESTTKTG